MPFLRSMRFNLFISHRVVKRTSTLLLVCKSLENEALLGEFLENKFENNPCQDFMLTVAYIFLTQLFSKFSVFVLHSIVLIIGI